MNAHPPVPRLDALFRARSLALVGAKQGSLWSDTAFENLAKFGYAGKVHVVSRGGGTVHGLPAATSCSAIGEPVDVALLMVPVDYTADVLADAAAAGVRNAVVLSAGYAEVGEAGKARQQQLIEIARGAGMRLLGPNCIGFVNLADRVPVWLNVPRLPILSGSIAVVSQSGAMATFIAYFAHQQGIGLSHIVSTGNEADINAAQVVDFLVEQPAVKTVALFLETVRDTALLAAAADKAAAVGKALVVLKVGSSEVTAKAAQSHTGALVGDDRIFDAACRRHAIVRVQSVEDLITTADLIARTGPVKQRRLGLVSISGGLCEIGADLADENGLELSTFSDHTMAALRKALPAYGTAANPLDLTGAAMLRPAIFTETLEAVGNDPDVGLIALANLEIGTRPQDIPPFQIERLEMVRQGLAKSRAPGVVITPSLSPVTDATRAVVEKSGITYLSAGIHHGLGAIERAFWWSARLEERQARPHAEPTAAKPAALASERAALGYLQGAGVPVIPVLPVSSADEAAAAATRLGFPVVLKIDSPDIQHKTEVGGVVLGLDDAAAVRQAYDTMIATVRQRAPQAAVSGALVAPQRERGLELFVGTMRDPDWGPAIGVGLGGIWVETLKDVSWRLLPVTPGDVLQMLGELRAAKLLDGYRGGPPVDRAAVAAAVTKIGDAALALGPSLVSLEINPLYASGATVEALDALAVFD